MAPPAQKSPSAIYQARFRERMRAQGFVKREVWIPPSMIGELKRVETRLRDGATEPQTPTVETMRTTEMTDRPNWTTETLFDALTASEAGQSGRIKLELIAGTDASILATMSEFGDLPVVMSVSGEQILAHVELWPVSAVRDPAAFNVLALKTHKLLPLSSFGIGTGSDGQPVYELFGALASGSLLTNVLLELETLADNALQVADALGDELRDAAA